MRTPNEDTQSHQRSEADREHRCGFRSLDFGAWIRLQLENGHGRSALHFVASALVYARNFRVDAKFL